MPLENKVLEIKVMEITLENISRVLEVTFQGEGSVVGGFLQLLLGKCLARNMPGLLLACALPFHCPNAKDIPSIPPGPNAAPTK